MRGLLDLLPPRIRQAVDEHAMRLMEVALDLGQPPEIRLGEGGKPLPVNGLAQVTRPDLGYIVAKLGARFREDRRAGVDGTLHRISAIVSVRGEVIGVTMRVGRHVYGAAAPLEPVLRAGKSLLIVGPPGSGKTTVLRDAARALSVEIAKRVVIVDTSGEVGGWGDVTHPAVGKARRIPVPDITQQFRAMLEAVQNHTPEVVIIDEIGRETEVTAAQTIAQRGVQLLATCHGTGLRSVVNNPTLRPLLGVDARGDAMEVAPFSAVAEVRGRGKFEIHRRAAYVVRAMLSGKPRRG
jgi:stage III sporulation protein AA